MQPSTESLEFELQEKNEIISLLTQQLEQAAEQLDRMHRQGESARNPDKNAKANLSAGVVEGMQNFLSDWDQLQPALTLGRIELALAQLQQSIEQSPPVARAAATQATRSTPASAGSDDFWSRMKSQIMDEPADTEKSFEPEPETHSLREQLPITKVEETEESDGTGRNIDETTETFDFKVKRIDEGPDLPADIDLKNATLDELQHAVDERDEYISYLHNRINQAENHQHFRLPQDWSVFGKYPGDLRVKLEFLEAQLLSVLRTSEIQQSMDRARNARIENKLRYERELVHRQARKLELNLDEMDLDETPKKEEKQNIKQAKSNKSWSLFGK